MGCQCLRDFQLKRGGAFDRLGFKRFAILTEFGALAQVSKDFGGSWPSVADYGVIFYPIALRSSLPFRSSDLCNGRW